MAGPDAVVVHVDGGARGNPGPAGVAAVAYTPDGAALGEESAFIGESTNNVAEYRALLLGLDLARRLGAREVEVVNDSELVARQVGGQYKVKHPGLRPLHREAMEAPPVVRPLVGAERAAGEQRARRRARQCGARRGTRLSRRTPRRLLLDCGVSGH